MSAPRAVRAALAVALWAWAGVATADAVDKLKAFIKATRSASAEFSQTVLDGRQRTVQRSGGTLQFQRPGRFRWAYDKPYEQVIVGDGEKLWIWDKDLNQVTARKLDQALGSSPAALLAGSNEIEQGFTLSDAGPKDGLDWLDAKPKSKETTFERVRMGFDARGDLAAMELMDTFGQTTHLKFSKLERNPKLDPGQFRFTPPKGADVVE